MTTDALSVSGVFQESFFRPEVAWHTRGCLCEIHKQRVLKVNSEIFIFENHFSRRGFVIGESFFIAKCKNKENGISVVQRDNLTKQTERLGWIVGIIGQTIGMHFESKKQNQKSQHECHCRRQVVSKPSKGDIVQLFNLILES